MAMNMSQFLLLADRDFSKVWMEQEDALPAEHASILNVGSFDGKLYRREAKMGGFGTLNPIADGGKVQYGEALTPVTKRYDFDTRGLAYVITRKLWENDEYGEVRRLEGALKRSTDDDIETFAFGLINNARNTTISTGFDGLALSSLAHTRLDGGATQANQASTALSLASVKDGVTAFRKFKDDRGRPYNSRPNQLLIPVDLEYTAEEIIGSPDRPDTANRAVNALRKDRLSWKSSIRITSTTFWALLGARHDMNLLWRNRPVTSSMEDWPTKSAHRMVYFDAGRGHGEWRDTYFGQA